MRMVDFHCKAGEPATHYVTGRYLRVLTGTDRLKVETDSGHNGYTLTGIGLDLLDPISGKGFTQIMITSPVDQVVTVLVSTLPSSDSRLSGQIIISETPPVEVASIVPVEVSKLPQVVQARASGWENGREYVTTGGTKKVLAANPARFSATVQVEVDVWVAGTSAKANSSYGLLLKEGQSFTHENTGELWARAATQTGSVRTMEAIQ